MSYRSPVPFLVGDSIQLEADTLPKPDSSKNLQFMIIGLS